MHPKEIWWLIEAKSPKSSTSFTESETAELLALLDPDATEKLNAINLEMQSRG